MSTMRDVAALAGVSAKTVSRVMNNDRYVSDEVKTRVLKAVAELNYVPNVLARTFRSGRDAAIGLAVPDIGDPFFASVARAIEQAARQRSVAVFVTSLGSAPENEQASVEALLSRQIVGLVIAPVAADQTYLQPWLGRIAVMFIDRPPVGLKAESVVEDDFGGAKGATAHLVGHGHRRIALAADSLQIPTTARRLTGYKGALAEAGLPFDDDLVVVLGSDGGEATEAALVASLSQPDPPTAVFSSNARTSIEIVPILHRLGRNDVAVVSFGDFPMADTLTPSVTVVDQDPLRLGGVAVSRLFERVDRPEMRQRRQVVLPVDLVARQSCGCDGPAATVRR
jgi:LacI family transcriptional regulator